MSGGTFDYYQVYIQQIADRISEMVENGDSSVENPEIKQKFVEAVKALRVAYVYTKRIDWLLSGDDDEKSFLERLDKDLKKLEL